MNNNDLLFSKTLNYINELLLLNIIKTEFYVSSNGISGLNILHSEEISVILVFSSAKTIEVLA